MCMEERQKESAVAAFSVLLRALSHTCSKSITRIFLDSHNIFMHIDARTPAPSPSGHENTFKHSFKESAMQVHIMITNT